MASWFSRRRRRVPAPRIGSGRRVESALKVDLSDLIPELVPFLGQVASLQFAAFETLSKIVALAPNHAAKEVVGAAAARTYDKYRMILPEITRHGGEPEEAMRWFADRIVRFREVTEGRGWVEDLLRVHVTAGILDDFFVALCDGFPAPDGERLAGLLAADSGQELVSVLLRETAEADPIAAARLALWGRRLVGDVLLMARSALNDATTIDSERIEPAFTQLITEHTRRMDAIGLTA